MKPLFFHGGLLLVAAGLALSVWSKDEPAPEKAVAQTEVWGGNQAGFNKLAFEGKGRKVQLDSQRDEHGFYYVGVADKDEAAPPPSHPPLGSAAPPPPGKPSHIRFVAVKAGGELVKGLAPLMALRNAGKLGKDRDAEFGLDKPEGTLKVTIDGRENVLTLGAASPGGGERYARYERTGEVLAIAGDVVQPLLFAESRLPERELHGFKPEEVSRVRISKGEKKRELFRLKDKSEGWADSASAEKQDETAGNWMTKVARLRGSDFVEKPPTPLVAEQAVVRLEYFDGGKLLGTTELYKLPGGEKGNEYLARSEWLRWYVKVLQSSAEQVEQDLASVLK